MEREQVGRGVKWYVLLFCLGVCGKVNLFSFLHKLVFIGIGVDRMVVLFCLFGFSGMILFAFGEHFFISFLVSVRVGVVSRWDSMWQASDPEL